MDTQCKVCVVGTTGHGQHLLIGDQLVVAVRGGVDTVLPTVVRINFQQCLRSS